MSAPLELPSIRGFDSLENGAASEQRAADKASAGSDAFRITLDLDEQAATIPGSPAGPGRKHSYHLFRVGALTPCIGQHVLDILVREPGSIIDANLPIEGCNYPQQIDIGENKQSNSELPQRRSIA